jgi:hypothetical protein
MRPRRAAMRVGIAAVRVGIAAVRVRIAAVRVRGAAILSIDRARPRRPAQRHPREDDGRMVPADGGAGRVARRARPGPRWTPMSARSRPRAAVLLIGAALAAFHGLFAGAQEPLRRWRDPEAVVRGAGEGRLAHGEAPLAVCTEGGPNLGGGASTEGAGASTEGSGAPTPLLSATAARPRRARRRPAPGRTQRPARPVPRPRRLLRAPTSSERAAAGGADANPKARGDANASRAAAPGAGTG